jgi:hypothetical protein
MSALSGEFIDGGNDDMTHTFKPVGSWDPRVVFADRFLALRGMQVFNAFFALGLVWFALLIPVFALVLYCWWPALVNVVFWLSLVACQCLLAYLREFYFYDSCNIYAFFGGLFALYLIAVSTVSMIVSFQYPLLIVFVTTIQLLQTFHACKNT